MVVGNNDTRHNAHSLVSWRKRTSTPCAAHFTLRNRLTISLDPAQHRRRGPLQCSLARWIRSTLPAARVVSIRTATRQPLRCTPEVLFQGIKAPLTRRRSAGFARPALFDAVLGPGRGRMSSLTEWVFYVRSEFLAPRPGSSAAATEAASIRRDGNTLAQ